MCMCVCGYITELPDKIQDVQLNCNFRETKNFFLYKYVSCNYFVVIFVPSNEFLFAKFGNPIM